MRIRKSTQSHGAEEKSSKKETLGSGSDLNVEVWRHV